MSSDVVIRFSHVFKRYSRNASFENNLREHLAGLFKKGFRRRLGLKDGEFWALQDLDLTIRRGECVGLCGSNGSGKSTLLKLVSNITFPTLGDVDVCGRVAPLIELGAGFHPDLNGIENIYMNGTILGLSIHDVKRLVNDIIEFAELNDFIRVPVKKYSSGMVLRLAFSIAIHSPADVYLFDEVLAVGDEAFRDKCKEK
ncbi:MAG: ABC transporter ATP-binding protein, partial [Gammaproteobacteria bacterium]